MAPPNWRGIWYPKGFDTDIRDERSSAMCGRLCPCGVAAPRLSFAGCPGVDGAASRVQVNAASRALLPGFPRDAGCPSRACG